MAGAGAGGDACGAAWSQAQAVMTSSVAKLSSAIKAVAARIGRRARVGARWVMYNLPGRLKAALP